MGSGMAGPSDSQTLDSGRAVQFLSQPWTTGPALRSQQDSKGCMGVLTQTVYVWVRIHLTWSLWESSGGYSGNVGY